MSNKPKGIHRQQIVHQQTSQTWSYPVPPPALFNQYDPAVKNQLLTEWTKEADHRRECEKKALEQRDQELEIQSIDIKASHSYDKIAVMISFIVIIALLGSTIWFAYTGKSIEAVTGLIATIALFFYKKKADSPN